MSVDGRICTQCNQYQSASEFSWKGKDHKRLASRCGRCRRANYKENPEVARARAKAYHHANRDKVVASQRRRRVDKASETLLAQAKKRAASRGLPFDLNLQDVEIPDRCPVLGMPLVMNKGRCGPDSPSLDRVIPHLGYVKGNVVVISHRANTVKSDASVDELAAVLAYVKAMAA